MKAQHARELSIYGGVRKFSSSKVAVRVDANLIAKTTYKERQLLRRTATSCALPCGPRSGIALPGRQNGSGTL